jgi:hypothetical protein
MLRMASSDYPSVLPAALAQTRGTMPSFYGKVALASSSGLDLVFAASALGR